MKKIIVMLLAVVLLVAGGLGGFAYASNNSHPMTGQKLVGGGSLGFADDPLFGGLVHFDTAFVIMNPDCVSEITIERISIIRGDGTVIFEGRLSELPVHWPPVLNDVLEPHQMTHSSLRYCMWDEESNWLEPEDALSLDVHFYTVEIFWTGANKGLPLTGWVSTLMGPEGDIKTEGITQMVNMEQKLKPTD